MRKIQDRYDNPDLEEAEIARLMGQDLEMQALVQKMRNGEKEEIMYESADEEYLPGEPEWYYQDKDLD